MKLNIDIVAQGMSKGMQSIKAYGDSLSKLTSQTKRAGSSMNDFYYHTRKMNNQFTNISKDANRASDSISKMANSFNKFVGMGQLYAIGRGLASMVQSSLDAIENQNLFNVAMGQTVDKAQKFVDSMHEAYGFDSSNIQSAVATYALLARSMGMSADQAETLSTNTYKLGVDLASLTNVPINQVMQDLRSGLIGQTETVYKYGVDLTEASLAQEALAEGVDKSVREMTQGEKMALRYNLLIKQTALAHGDFANTINSPANQLKILSERFVTLGRAIGNIFIPILSATLPYINAFVIVLTELANAVASFFGYQKDSSGASAGLKNNLTGGAESADAMAGSLKDSNKELKKMKQNTLGFDELHVISPEDSSSGAGGSGAGGGASALAGMDLSSFDNLMGGINDKTKAIVKAMKENLPWIKNMVEDIGIAFLSWKIAELILKLIEFYKKLREIWLFMTGMSLLPLTAGASALYSKLLLVWSVFKLFAGVFLIIEGLRLAFDGFTEILKSKQPTIESWLKLVTGLFLAFAGFSILFVTLGGTFTGVTLAIGLIVIALTTLAVAIYKYHDEILAYISQKWDAIKKTFSDALDAIAKWVKETFTGVGVFVKSVFGDMGDNIKSSINGAISFLTNTVPSFFGQLAKDIGSKLNEIFGFFTQWGINIVNWATIEVPNVVSKIVGFFGGLASGIWTWLGTVLTNFGTWASNTITWAGQKLPEVINSIINWFAKIPESMGNIGKNMIKSLWNGIVGMGTWLYDKVIKYFGKLGGIISDYIGKIGVGSAESLLNIKTYASGGFPDYGQMFIANEAGAELVGSINRKTAVVNNDQIVEAVSQGVAQAVASVIGDGGKAQVIENILQLDGEVIYKNQQKIQRGRGVNFGMGVFAR